MRKRCFVGDRDEMATDERGCRPKHGLRGAAEPIRQTGSVFLSRRDTFAIGAQEILPMYIWAQLEMGNMDCWVPCCYDSRDSAEINGFGVKAPSVLRIAINGLG